MKQLLITLPAVYILLFGSIKNGEFKKINHTSYIAKVNSLTPYDLVKQAIQSKQSVTFYYKGYLRKASPHVIGTKNGRQQALFYQYGGQSHSGLSSDPSDNWRCIYIDGIEDLSINDDEFATASNHTQRQSCVDIVDKKVNY